MTARSDTKLDGRERRVSGGKSWWLQRGVLGVVCGLVVGVYMFGAQSGSLELMSPAAADTYYNLLVQGFRTGQLNVKKEVPPGFAQLADPYDPTANIVYRSAPFGMHDLSYYKGRLYLYFGVTPALILFWPFAALTRQYLFHRQATTLFCAIGFLASVGLLRGLWRRYFAEVRIWVVAVCALALGLATGVPALLPRSEVYEVPISCGYMLTMLALGAIWRALHEPDRQGRWFTTPGAWLAAASMAYGLAVGARPNLLFGAVILLVPVAQAWRDRKPVWALLTAAVVPVTLIGLGLMVYNALRFDNPFEFGGHYQLGTVRMDTGQYFGLHYLWFNVRMYFLEPARWSSPFPFIRETALPPVPTGHLGNPGEKPFGVLINMPLMWLALAAPLAWRGRSVESHSILRQFVAGVTLVFGIDALVLCLFRNANFRYEVDLLPALVMLAVVGILALERVLAPTSESGLADRPVRRRAVRWGWGLLLGFSVAFNLLASVKQYAEADCILGNALLQAGRIPEAMGHYEQALRIKTDYAEAHNNLGVALQQTGKLEEAIGHYEQALRIKPDYAIAHYNLGMALEKAGRIQEAIAHYEQALRIKPDFAGAQINLARARAVQ